STGRSKSFGLETPRVSERLALASLMLTMRTLSTVTEGGSGASMVGLVVVHAATNASAVTTAAPHRRHLKAPPAPTVPARAACPCLFSLSCPLQGFTKARLASRTGFHSAGESHLLPTRIYALKIPTRLAIAAIPAANRSAIITSNYTFCAR